MSPKTPESHEHGFREVFAPPDSLPAGWRTPGRGARLPGFVSMRADPETTLSSLRVAVVGAGAVGRNALHHLARLAPEQLWIVDRGRFKAQSLLTQPILPRDIPRVKATNAGEHCKTISPGTRVFVHDGPVEELPIAAFSQADAVLLATDNLAAEVEVGARCLHLAKPLVHAAVHGETLTAQVRTYANRDGSGPCPACGFGESEWQHLNRETSFSCEGLAAGRPAPQSHGPATVSTSFLCSLAADLALVQLLRLTLGLGQDVADTFLEYCGFTHRTVITPLVRNPHCRCEHAAWKIAKASAPLRQLTLRDLAREAGCRDEELATASFSVDEIPYVEAAVCPTGHIHTIRRFLALASDAGECPTCGAMLRPHPFYAHRPVPARIARPQLDRPLGELTSAPPRAVIVRAQGGGTLILANGTAEQGNPT
jgi:molybdopterin/thiamine biosynthesis adenylyltransferase